jgi:hypothetical protein
MHVTNLPSCLKSGNILHHLSLSLSLSLLYLSLSLSFSLSLSLSLSLSFCLSLSLSFCCNYPVSAAASGELWAKNVGSRTKTSSFILSQVGPISVAAKNEEFVQVCCSRKEFNARPIKFMSYNLLPVAATNKKRVCTEISPKVASHSWR